MGQAEPLNRVGEWQVDTATHSLSKDGQTVRLTPKAMQALTLLAEHRGAVVSRSQILDYVWHGRVVVEESVTQVISELRKALGDERSSPRYIQTIPKSGYRLIAPVTTVAAKPDGRRADSVRVAVLPFVDLSESRDQGYFCDGMADELIGALFQVRGLKVISRTASFNFRTSSSDPREIGAHLGATHLVEGSVRRQDDALRISVRLIELPDGDQCWSGRFDRSREDLFAVQDEIARQVAQRLQSEVPVLRKRQQPHLLAYDYYLRGRQYFYRGGEAAGRLGREMFRRAIEVDGDYALAHAGLADMYTFGWLYYFDDPALLPQALSLAERAIRLAPDLAEAHAALGSVYSAANDYEKSKAAFTRAIALNPNLFEPHYLFGRANLVAARWPQAVASFEMARQIRPESIQVYTLLARAHRALGDTDRELEAYSLANEIVKHQLQVLPDDARILCVAASCAAALGAPERARNLVALANRSDDPMHFYAACALVRAGFGDEALSCLETACKLGWNHLAWLENDPELEGIRDTARFEAVRSRLASRLPALP